MKPFNTLHKFLLLTTMLFAPSVAMAQQAPETEDPAYGEDEIVVLGRFIPTPQQETSEVAAFLSAEDLERQGDDTAAAALTRMTGLSVVSGRFVFVRGLGDRYSSALLNGSPLPSPEPLRRTVPLDLFPSSVLEGAVVQKTYSANYPGEFGGGIIDLETVALPTETFNQFKFGVSGNSEATARNGVYVRGSDTDWSGYDDGLRDMPGPLAAAIASGERFSNLSDEQLETIGESFVNSPVSVLQSGHLGSNFEAEYSGGTSINSGIFNIGLVGAAGYDSSWRTERATRQLVGQAQIDADDSPAKDFDSFTTTLDTTVNALGTASIGWNENQVQATLLYVHSTSEEAQFQDGFDFNAPGTTHVRDESTGWYERELTTLQLAGEHALGNLNFDWRTAASRSRRDAPYERSLRRIYGEDGVLRYSQSNNYDINFSELEDENISGGADLSYTLALSPERDAVFSAGYDYSNTVRNYEFQKFRFAGGNSLPEDVQIARPDYLFSPDNIDPARFELIELTSSNDAYKGGLLVNAAYVQADVEILPLIRTAIGVRYEEGKQTVRTSNRFGDPTSPEARIENEYVLPAATVTWNFAEDLQMRLGYSQTIARPQFRELARSFYRDPDTDRAYRGNDRLEDSELVNYDARLEYYLGANQFITGGLFYKDIERPIEEASFEPSTFNYETTFINVPRAIIYGVELEYRTKVASPFEGAWWDDKDWLFAINYTYTSSEVQAGAGDQIFNPFAQQFLDASLFEIDGAQLQGTPENILNVQFGWEGEVSQLTMLVGWVDERILQRGIGSGASQSLPDIIEDPGVNLDLVYRRNFTVGESEITFGLSGRNLLGEQHVEYQESALGRTDFNTYDRGTSLSASLSTRF